MDGLIRHSPSIPIFTMKKVKSEFSGFNPYYIKKNELKRYFRMAAKEGIKFTKHEKNKIKREALKNVKNIKAI